VKGPCLHAQANANSAPKRQSQIRLADVYNISSWRQC